ncbi:universal stress protein [Salinimicrobium flavum]|uniref:Universal stress protein n=1 Tax=Salinimicrobium flavum TaxID=1737065 RepID=A0ABW5J1D0_9FLAO
MKNILLPTDFSKCSTNAILYTLRLFKGTSCTFHLLSIYKAWNYTSGDLMQASADDSLYDILISENKSKLEKLMKRISKNSVDEDFTFHALTDYDVFTDSINKFIEVKHIDLIVMGTDGASDAKEKLFGSHTLRVIRKVDSPLLIIPAGLKFHMLRRLLLILDHSVDFEQTSLKPLLELIGNHSFSMEILKMSETGADAEVETAGEKELKDHFAIYNPEYHRVSDTPTHEAVISLVESRNIDMNILPVRKEDFLERIFGSHLSKIIYSTPVPLFILQGSRAGKKS